MDDERPRETAPREAVASAPDDRDTVLAAANAERQAAVERTRELLLASDPRIPAEAVGGETLADVEESFARARALAERVQREVEVGAGAPGRVTATPSTPFEKIRAGLAALD